MRKLLILGLVIAAITFSGFKADAADKSTAIRAAIEAGTAEWVKQYNAGNIAGVTALYAEDAKVLPPNSDVVSGQEAINGVFKSMLDSGAKSVKLTPDEVIAMGDKASDIGTYEVMDAQGKVVDKGKYMVIWKKSGSGWKLYRDMWNTSMPAPAAQ